MSDNVHKINTGNMATIAYNKFEGVVLSQQYYLLSQAKANFRAGQLSHDQHVALLAGLNALDDILTVLKQQIIAGSKVQKENTKNDDQSPNQ